MKAEKTPQKVKMTKDEDGVTAVANVPAADVAIWEAKGWKAE